MVRGEPADQERAIGRALDAGVNYFDTAVQYGNGESEKNLGRILARLKPRDAIVGTKVRLLPGTAQSAQAIATSLEGSLQRLGREQVDVLHFHNPVTLASGIRLPVRHPRRSAPHSPMKATSRAQRCSRVRFRRQRSIGWRSWSRLSRARSVRKWPGETSKYCQFFAYPRVFTGLQAEILPWPRTKTANASTAHGLR